MYDDDDPLRHFHPTIVWPSGWTAVCGQMILPLAPECYGVEHTAPWWSIVLDPDGVVVYRGFGPVTVVRSPAPKRIVDGFRGHWAAHGNDEYPQRFRLPPEEQHYIDTVMHKGRHPGIMWGVPLEADPTTKGEMIAIDGTVVSIAPTETAS